MFFFNGEQASKECLLSLCPFIQVISEADYGKGLHSFMNLEQSGACEGQFEEDYHPLRPLGKGAFGVVWLASRRRDEQEVRKYCFQNSMA